MDWVSSKNAVTGYTKCNMTYNRLLIVSEFLVLSTCNHLLSCSFMFLAFKCGVVFLFGCVQYETIIIYATMCIDTIKIDIGTR